MTFNKLDMRMQILSGFKNDGKHIQEKLSIAVTLKLNKYFSSQTKKWQNFITLNKHLTESCYKYWLEVTNTDNILLLEN